MAVDYNVENYFQIEKNKVKRKFLNGKKESYIGKKYDI